MKVSKVLSTGFMILGALAIVFAASIGRAAEGQVKCVHQDGYGSYVGYGADKNEARSMASTSCFEQQVELFVQTKGHLPSDEEAEPIMLSCVNICP